MDTPDGDVAGADGVADVEVAACDDRVALGAEVTGAAVQGCEVGRHHHRGDHGDEDRGGTQRERAG